MNIRLVKGTPCLVAVEQDYTGKALDRALAYGLAIGGARAGLLETDFRTETENRPFRRAGSTLRWCMRIDAGRIRDTV